jgi:Ras-related protein Rab-1A
MSGKELADSLGIKFLETSAKEAVNVEKAFITLSSEIRSKVKPRGGPTAGDAGKGKTIIKPTDQKPDQKKSGCC